MTADDRTEGIPRSHGMLFVTSQEGIHARPAARIVQLVVDSGCSAVFTYGDNTADAASILDLLTLGVPGNTQVGIDIHGARARDLLMNLERLFAHRFDLE